MSTVKKEFFDKIAIKVFMLPRRYGATSTLKSQIFSSTLLLYMNFRIPVSQKKKKSNFRIPISQKKYLFVFF